MSEFNFKSQICTSKVQSERLLALGLKPETADMSWIFSYHWECFVGNPEELYTPDEDGCDDVYIPAWSLHRLIILIGNIACDWIFRNDDCYTNAINCIEWLIKEGYFNKEYLV